MSSILSTRTPYPSDVSDEESALACLRLHQFTLLMFSP
jgi:hypothetical protein